MGRIKSVRRRIGAAQAQQNKQTKFTIQEETQLSDYHGSAKMVGDFESALSDHQKNSMIMQSGDKPFICGLCGRPFMQCDALGLHMRVHTDGHDVSTLSYTNQHFPSTTLKDSIFERITGPEILYSGSCGDYTPLEYQSTSPLDCQSSASLDCRSPAFFDCQSSAFLDCQSSHFLDCQSSASIDCQNSASIDYQSSASIDYQSSASVDCQSAGSLDCQSAVSLGCHTLSLATSKTPEKRTLNIRTVQEKYEAILEVERGVKTKSQIARDLGINTSTLSTWLKNSDAIKQGYETFNPKRRKMRCGKWDELECALMKWFKFARDQDAVMSGPLLMSKAEQLAETLGFDEFKSSTGWLDRFKDRNGIVFRSLKGESNRVNKHTDKINSGIVRREEIMKIYRPEDIYNAAETCLFFTLLPENTITIKGSDCHFAKKSKERLTVLVCANMDGSDKCELFVIGKSEKPKCFKNVKTLPTYYTHNNNARITGEIFEAWVSLLDKRMRCSGRYIALFVDQALCDPKIRNLTNVNIFFLAPNTANNTQPMNQGVIQNLKVHYRKLVVLRQLSAIEKKSDFRLNVLDAMRLLQQSWYCMRPATINNGYIHAGFTSKTSAHEDDVTTDEFDHIPLERIASIGKMAELQYIQDFVSFDDDDVLTSTSLAEDDIIKDTISRRTTSNVQNDSDKEQDEDFSIPETPTDDQAMTALATLRAYFESLENTQNESKIICALSSSIVRQQLFDVEKLKETPVKENF